MSTTKRGNFEYFKHKISIDIIRHEWPNWFNYNKINGLFEERKAMAKKKEKLLDWDESFPEILKEKGLGSKLALEYINLALNDPDPRMLGIAIKHMLKASSFTIEEIKKSSGVGLRTITRLRKGEGIPTPKTIDAVFKTLGFEIKYTAKFKENKTS